MDARNWGTHGTSFREIKGPAVVPIPERVNCLVATAATTTEIKRAGKYTVLHSEVGSHRLRSGKLAQRNTAPGSLPFIEAGGFAPNVVNVSNTPNIYETGDGPIYFSSFAMMTGNPSVEVFVDKIVRSTGSWVTDGFSGAVLCQIDTRPGGGVNYSTQIISSISTTTNPDDTINVLGTMTPETIGSDALVTRAQIPLNVVSGQPFFAVNTSFGLQLATSRANALAGIIYNVSDNGFDTMAFGGDMGPYFPAGFYPGTPTLSSKRGEGEKLLRVGETVISTSRWVTVRSQTPGDVLKWWSID